MSLFKWAVGDLNKIPIFPKDNNFSISNIKRFLSAVENPHQRYNRVQIVGTNGKGSVALFLTKILTSHGLKVGLYTSPHLVCIRERISVGESVISEDEFAEIYKDNLKNFEKHKLTHFERLTALAAIYFYKNRVDFAVFETGLGGRKDSVTSLESDICAFTSISLDHMEFLGETLEEISFDKAHAMIKAKRAYSVSQKPEVNDVLNNFAEKYDVPLFFSPELRGVSTSKTGTRFELAGRYYDLGMLGAQSALNASLAIRVSKEILKQNFDYNLAYAGLQGSYFRGRLEFVHRDGFSPTLLSCAHNLDSLRNDLSFINSLIRKGEISENQAVLFGLSGVRDSEKFIRELRKTFKKITVTKVPSFDIPFERLKSEPGIELVENPDEAFKRVLKSGCSGAIVIGSIYLCGLALEYMGVRDLSELTISNRRRHDSDKEV